MAKISNGRVTIEVPDDKALHYCTSMGYHIVNDEKPEVVEDEKPAPRRGRPPKKAS